MYAQVRLRFENVDWPEMPPKFQLIKKIETRIQAFDKMMKKILEVARVHSAGKKSLLGLSFAFLLDEGNCSTVRTSSQILHEENKKRLAQEQGRKSSEALSTNQSMSKQTTEGDDDSDSDDLEHKYLNLDLDNSRFSEEYEAKAEFTRSMPDLDFKMKPETSRK